MNIVLAIIAPRPDFPQVRIIPGTFISGFFISCIVLMSLQGNSQARETASMNSYYGGMLFSNNQSVVDSTQSEELMLEGVKEKIIGNLSLAQDFFMQSLRADARNDASLYELSLIELGKKNYEKARQYIVLALKVKPLESYYLSVLVDIYTGSQNTEGLIKTYSILIKQSPLNGNLYLNMADVLVSQNKIEQAIILFSEYEKISGEIEMPELQKQKIFLTHNLSEKALVSMQYLLTQYPRNTRYYLLISEIYRSLGRFDEAFASLNHAQKLSPEDGFIKLGFFEYFASRGQILKADSALEKLGVSEDISTEQKVKILQEYYLEKNLGMPDLVTRVAKQLKDDNPDNKEVKELFEKIKLKNITSQKNNRGELNSYLEKQGGDFRAWINLINLDLEAGDPNSADKHASSALELYPNQLNLYGFKAEALRQLKKYNSAVQVLKGGLVLSAGKILPEARLLEELGNVYQAENKYDQADSAYNESLKMDESPVVLNNFAYYLSLRNTKLGFADSLSVKANSLKPKNANFEDTYAWILYKEKQFRKSLIWIEKCIDDDKTNTPTFWDHYGDILFENKQQNKALEAWKKSLAFGSKNVFLLNKINDKHP